MQVPSCLSAGFRIWSSRACALKTCTKKNFIECQRGSVPSHNIITSFPCWVLRFSGVGGVISQGIFGNNSAGPVIGMTGTRLVIKRSAFSGNKATSGVAITAWSGNSLTLIDCRFDRNVAYGFANMPRSDNAAYGNADMTLYPVRDGIAAGLPTRQESDTQSYLCWDCGYGGAVLVYNSSVRIVNITFDNNMAELGGALFLDFNASGSCKDSYFRRNTALVGGGIAANVAPTIGNNNRLLLDSTRFDLNMASAGSSLWVAAATNGVVNDDKNNTSGVRISRCTFDQSDRYEFEWPLNQMLDSFKDVWHTTVDAGSISAYHVDLQIVNSIIKRSWCTGVYYETSGDVKVGQAGCRITNSNISGNGLAAVTALGDTFNCSAIDTNAHVIIDGASLITDNIGTYGAGIHIRDRDSHGSRSVPGLLRTMMSSRIRNNNATVAGGGVFCDSANCIVENDADDVQKSIYNNTSPVAPDLFVPPHTLSLLDGSLDAHGRVVNLTSYGAVAIRIKVTGGSGKGFAVGFVPYIAKVRSVSKGTVVSFVNTTNSAGVATFMLRVPIDHYNVSVSLFAVVDSPYLPYAAGQPDAITKHFELILQGCNVGQVVSDGLCQPCPEGSYSVHVEDALCTPCPVDSALCLGGVLIVVPRVGSWHSTRLATSLQQCPNPDACQQSSNPDACQQSSNQQFRGIIHDCRDVVVTASDSLATRNAKCQQLHQLTMHMSNSTYSDLLCSPGYAGNLCGVCQRDRGYVLVKPFHCKECHQSSIIVLLYVVSWVLLLCMIKVLCHLTLRDAPAAMSGATLSATFIMKPFVLYLQYMLIVGTLSIQWPLPISAGFFALSVLFSSAAGEAISIGCLLSNTPAWPVAIRRTLFYLSMPFVTLAALLLCECAWHVLSNARSHLQHRPSGITLTDHLLSSSMVVLFFFLPSLARTTLNLFACIKVDTFDAPAAARDAVGSFWVSDMTQRCYHGYHRGWALGLVIPLAFLLCAGLPVAILCVVFSKRINNSSDHFVFLHQMYRPSHRYWEAVVTLQTLVLIAISVFGYNVGVYAQAVMTTFALVVILIMLIAVKPYAQRASHLVMCSGITCAFVTSYMAHTMWTDKCGFVVGDMYRIVAASFVVLMNLVYIVFVARQLQRCVDWRTMMSAAVAKAARVWQCFGRTARSLPHCSDN